jgi:hypothetical protein
VIEESLIGALFVEIDVVLRILFRKLSILLRASLSFRSSLLRGVPGLSIACDPSFKDELAKLLAIFPSK